MKKILLIATLLLISIIAISCNNNDNKTGVQNNGNSSNVNTPSSSTQSDVTKDYNEPKFMEEQGYNVTKDTSLQDITYDNIRISDEGRAELDLNFKDGKKATLMIYKQDVIIDEEEATNFNVENIEVFNILGGDGFKNYYWKKDYKTYRLIVTGDTVLSNDEVGKIIKGFNVEVGENY